MPDSETPRARRDLVLQELGDEGVLHDREGARIHILNPTALFAWKLCDGSRSIEEISKAIQGAFSGTEGIDIGTEVRGLLASMAEKGLLEQRRNQPGA